MKVKGNYKSNSYSASLGNISQYRQTTAGQKTPKGTYSRKESERIWMFLKVNWGSIGGLKEQWVHRK